MLTLGGFTRTNRGGLLVRCQHYPYPAESDSTSSNCHSNGARLQWMHFFLVQQGSHLPWAMLGLAKAKVKTSNERAAIGW